MTSSISWVQIGDLHADEKTDFTSLGILKRIIEEIELHIAASIDFVYLPGDIANHGTSDQYAAIHETLKGLMGIPYRAIPGDHDFEPGNLDAYNAAFSPENRPEIESIKGHRCIFLDIVSAGAGGPDFRLPMHHRNRLGEELTRAQACGEVPLVFMHAYPGDLAADGDEVARTFSDGHVAYVATGHTHYNEILNDTRVLYGSVRSTGEIEEGEGRPGYAVITVHNRVVSWCFREIQWEWPLVQIISPSDRRLVTRPADARQIPRPGNIEIVTKLFGWQSGDVRLSVDGATPTFMIRQPDGLWTATVSIDNGLHRAVVECEGQSDDIEFLVRPQDNIPKQVFPVALGRSCHAIGAWPSRGIDGAQLGPNKNGKKW